MEEQQKEQAKELSGRAARQARHAARNGAKAAAEVAEGLGEDIQEGAENVVEAGKRLRPDVLSLMSVKTGVGFLGIGIGIACCVAGGRSIREAIADRKQVVR